MVVLCENCIVDASHLYFFVAFFAIEVCKSFVIHRLCVYVWRIIAYLAAFFKWLVGGGGRYCVPVHDWPLRWWWLVCVGRAHGGCLGISSR